MRTDNHCQCCFKIQKPKERLETMESVQKDANCQFRIFKGCSYIFISYFIPLSFLICSLPCLVSASTSASDTIRATFSPFFFKWLPPSFHHFYWPFPLFWGFLPSFWPASLIVLLSLFIPPWKTIFTSLPPVTLLSLYSPCRLLFFGNLFLSLNSVCVSLPPIGSSLFAMTQSSLFPVESRRSVCCQSVCAQAVTNNKKNNESSLTSSLSL